MRTFADLVVEAAAADVSGWGFGWLDGRATEERPPWGYSRLLASRLPHVASALDIDTGGGEILAEMPVLPPRMVVTEGWFLGPLPRERLGRDPGREAAAAESAGLQIIDLRTARCRMEFFDVGAVVYILRKCVWWVPDFTVGRYREALERLDAHIREHGAFRAHSTRTLIEARRRPR